jgi:ATP-dependent RNA helicase RhlE
VSIENTFRSRNRSRRSNSAPRPNNNRSHASEQRQFYPSAPPPIAKVHSPMTPEMEANVLASPFSLLGLRAPLVRAVIEEGYGTPSPVQTDVIPHVLEARDMIACAQTGTGKTAAFVLPILQRLTETKGSGIRALILTPTRELAIQIAERASVYGKHLDITHAVVYGGVSQHRQEVALRQGVDLVVATPGRLLDLIGQRIVKLDTIEFFVLDEADRMLDMGFVHDVRRVVASLPQKRQTLFFSATMAPPVDQLARTMLVSPVRVSITPQVTTAEGVDQSVMFVGKMEKRALLENVLKDTSIDRALVFTRTKHGANRLSEQLERSGIVASAIHGNKSQGARERALESFRAGTTRVLVATDLAARGIDVDGISLVVNFDLPNVAESYVHRIGRTGRAGATGRAISLCDSEERSLLRDIERFIRRSITVVATPANLASSADPAARTQLAPARSFAESSPQNRSRRYRGSRPR